MAFVTYDAYLKDDIRYQILHNRERALSQNTDYMTCMNDLTFNDFFNFHVGRIDVWINGRATFVDQIMQMLRLRVRNEYAHRMRIAEFVLFLADWESSNEKINAGGFMMRLQRFYHDIENMREKARKQAEEVQCTEPRYSPMEYYYELIRQGRTDAAEQHKTMILPLYERELRSGNLLHL